MQLLNRESGRTTHQKGPNSDDAQLWLAATRAIGYFLGDSCSVRWGTASLDFYKLLFRSRSVCDSLIEPCDAASPDVVTTRTDGRESSLLSECV